VLTVSALPEAPAARWGRLVDLSGKGKTGFGFFSAHGVFLWKGPRDAAQGVYIPYTVSLLSGAPP
jgi:hypothetical protein